MSDKVVKCILVSSDTLLITEIEELIADIGEPDCKLTNPYKFVSLEDMSPWINASNQSEYMIRSSDILTIADPKQEIISKYLELTS